MNKTKVLILASTLLTCCALLTSCGGNGNADESSSETATHKEEIESGAKSRIGEGIRQGVNGIANGVKSGVEGATNGIANGVNGIKNGVKRGIDNVRGGLMGDPASTEDATHNEIVESPRAETEGAPLYEGRIPHHRPPVPRGK